MQIKYKTSVHTPAGWRNVEVLACAEKISAGMAKVVAVLALDGDAPVGTLSVTGAKRQQYYAGGVALREIGAKKRLSACEEITE